MTKLKTKKLKNGLLVVTDNRPTNSVTVEVLVKTGSNNEKKLKGIAHFVEHMLFEGTKTRTQFQIADEIESLGGEFNAATSNEVTVYYIQIAKKHLRKAIAVLSDIVFNPLFDNKLVEKQRKIILDEVNLVTDEPRFHQWVLMQKALYKKYPSGLPVYGNKESILAITRKDLLEFHNANYIPSNMILSLAGNLPKNTYEIIKRYFSIEKKGRPYSIPKTPSKISRSVIKREKRDLMQSYIVVGYAGVRRHSKDSYVLDVIRSILGRGQSGRMFQTIRSKHGLAYEVGVINESSVYYGFFAVYANTHKENLNKVMRLIKKEIKDLSNIDYDEIKRAKESIEGAYLLQNEDTHNLAESNAMRMFAGSDDYIKNIRKVTKKDILRIQKKYLLAPSATAIIEQDSF